MLRCHDWMYGYDIDWTQRITKMSDTKQRLGAGRSSTTLTTGFCTFDHSRIIRYVILSDAFLFSDNVDLDVAFHAAGLLPEPFVEDEELGSSNRMVLNLSHAPDNTERWNFVVPATCSDQIGGGIRADPLATSAEETPRKLTTRAAELGVTRDNTNRPSPSEAFRVSDETREHVRRSLRTALERTYRVIAEAAYSVDAMFYVSGENCFNTKLLRRTAMKPVTILCCIKGALKEKDVLTPLQENCRRLRENRFNVDVELKSPIDEERLEESMNAPVVIENDVSMNENVSHMFVCESNAGR